MVLDLRREKSISIPLTDVGDTRTSRTCHFQDAYHFILGNRERRQLHIYILESRFFGIWWGRASKRARLLGLAVRQSIQTT